MGVGFKGEVGCCRGSKGGDLLAAGEGHDFLGGHGALALAVPAQVGDQLGASAVFVGCGGGDEADGGAVVFEGDFGVGHEAGTGADIGADGDLAFGVDAPGRLRGSYIWK